MPAELGLDRAVGPADRFLEDDAVELRNHLSGSELAKVATAASRRAAGVFPRQCREIGAVVDLLLQVKTQFLTVYEDMPGTCCSHIGACSVDESSPYHAASLIVAGRGGNAGGTAAPPGVSVDAAAQTASATPRARDSCATLLFPKQASTITPHPISG